MPPPLSVLPVPWRTIMSEDSVWPAQIMERSPHTQMIESTRHLAAGIQFHLCALQVGSNGACIEIPIVRQRYRTPHLLGSCSSDPFRPAPEWLHGGSHASRLPLCLQ